MKLVRVTYVDYLPEWPDDDYDPDDLTVRVVGRSADGEKITRLLSGTDPHCYVPADEPLPERDTEDWTVLDVQGGFQGIDVEAGEKVDVQRVTLGHPKQTDSFRDEFSASFEADIPYYRRVTWDHNLNGYIRVPGDVQRCSIDDIETDIAEEEVDPIDPRVAVGDIEVADQEPRGFDEMAREADAPIVAATWYDSYEDYFEVIVVDPERETDPSGVKRRLSEHWGDHDLAPEYVEEADIRLKLVDTETDLLKKSIGFVQRTDPDITAGWNWVDFDWYYLLERSTRLDDVNPNDWSTIGRVKERKIEYDRRGVESAVEGLPAFDQMAGLDKQTYGEWRSTRLEFVASEELGIGKIPDITVSTAYTNGRRSEMTAYNLLDVQLTVALTEKHGIEDFWLSVADLCGIQIQDSHSEKRAVQGYIGARRSDDQVMPTNQENPIGDPAGGLVLMPGDGTYRFVAVLDLKSLYPSGIVTCNISPETHTQDLDAADVVIPGMPEKAEDVGGRIEPSDINWEYSDESMPWSQRPKGFEMDEQGILPEYAAQMFPEREKRKAKRNEYEQGSDLWIVWDNQQRGIKVVHNSMFGVENSRYFPLAKAGIGDAITGISRYILWRGAERVRDIGYDVVYGDTDSVLVSMEYGEDRSLEEAVKDAKGLQSELNAHMSTVAEDLGLPDPHPYIDQEEMPHELPDDANHLWFWEFEKMFEDFIQVGSKKRYAGTLGWKEGEYVDGDLSVTGFEAERSDSMEITAEVQRQVIRAILDGWGFNEVSEMVREELDRFSANADDLHEIGVPWNLGKPLEGPDSYGNIPRARAARFSNKHLDKDYSPGDDFRGYYIKRTPSFVPETDVLALDWTDDIPEGYALDRRKTIEKAFESALTPILEEVDWTFNEVIEGKRNQPAVDDAITDYDGDPFASAAESDAQSGSSGAEGQTSEPDEEPEEDTATDTQGALSW
jgi:DNA polymerase I